MKRTLNRGVSLIELLIVIAVATIVISVGIRWAMEERRVAMRDDVVAQQSQELGALTRALAEHLNTATGLPTAMNTPFDVSIPTLVTAGLLPPNFAIRSGATTATAFTGQTYRVRAVRTTAGYRGVVYMEGAPQDTVMGRLGMGTDNASLRMFHQGVMRRARTSHAVQVGVVPAFSSAVDSVVSGFTYDLSGILPSVVGHTTAVALANYSDLNTTPPVRVTLDPASLPGNSEPPSLQGRACYVNSNGNTCAAGYTAVWTYKMCQEWGPGLNPPRSVRVTLGADAVTITRSNSPWPPGMSGGFGPAPTPSVRRGSWVFAGNAGSTSSCRFNGTSWVSGTITNYRCSVDPTNTIYTRMACADGRADGVDPGLPCGRLGDQPVGNWASSLNQTGASSTFLTYWRTNVDQTSNLISPSLAYPTPHVPGSPVAVCPGSSPSAVPFPSLVTANGNTVLTHDGNANTRPTEHAAWYYIESMTYGSTTISSGYVCSYRMATNAASINSHVNSGPARTFTNGCPVQSYPSNVADDLNGSVTSGRQWQLFEASNAAAAPSVAVCCQNPPAP